MELIQTVASLIVTLGILVTIHEYGHFWVARKCGVKVLRFSVGFGKPLYSWYDKRGTEFAIAAIPLGGYVKMVDEREGDVAAEDLEYAFNRKSVGQRMAVAAAGPAANFLFAIVCYWMMYFSGFNVVVPMLGPVVPGSEAEQAGLRQGYEIVEVDHKRSLSWRDVSMNLLARVGDSGEISLMAKDGRYGTPRDYRLEIDRWLSDTAAEDLDPLASLGIQPYRPEVPAIMDRVLDKGAAKEAGIKPGDEVVAVDDRPVANWHDFVTIVKSSPEKEIVLTIKRKNEQIQIPVRPKLKTLENGEHIGLIGVQAVPIQLPENMIRELSYGPFDSFSEAIRQTWSDTVMTLAGIKKMALGLISVDNLSGPITIARVASASISSGTEDFLRLLALLSVSLGVLNLLPIPVLDGGHLLYYAAEAIMGRPLPEKWQVIGLKIGISFILLLMTLAFYNDIMRL